MKQLHDWFLTYKEADGCQPSTLRWFRRALSDLERFCQAQGYSTDLATLQEEHLVEWLVCLRTRINENPRYKDCTAKLKPNTINNYGGV